MNRMAAEWGMKEWGFAKSSWKTCKISSLVNCQGDCFGHVWSSKIEQRFVVGCILRICTDRNLILGVLSLVTPEAQILPRRLC